VVLIVALSTAAGCRPRLLGSVLEVPSGDARYRRLVYVAGHDVDDGSLGARDTSSP
jgi:hypothetical protein